jgi:dolichyl-phosphate beta-glucosyltransferase
MPEGGTGSLTLVVPLFNETRLFSRHAAELAAFVACQPRGSELVFVDDGSHDSTAEMVDAFLASSPPCPARLVRRPHRGKGAAVQAGLATAGTPLAAFCDLDLSTPLGELARLVDAARQAPIIAIASRDLAASRVTRHEGLTREFLGRAYNRAVQLIAAPGIVDTQCGAKAARTELWQRILPLCGEPGFAWDVEVVATAAHLGIAVQEVAVEWHHVEDSRVRVLRDGFSMLRALPRIRRNLRQLIMVPPTTSTPTPALAASGARASASGVFDDENASALAAVDGAHWWFRSKAAFVQGTLRRYPAPPGRLVDLGAGSGGVTAMLGWRPDMTLVVEGNTALVREAQRRHALTVVQSDLSHIPLQDATASVVCLLDVIEHLDSPRATLLEARRVLAPGGRLIVNVPGHPRLWSAADEALGHVRRYTRTSLRAELQGAGFDVVFLSHIFSWLFLPVWARRRLHRGEPQLGLDVDSAIVDRTALLLTRLERAVVNRVALPAGTSVLCVATPHG